MTAATQKKGPASVAPDPSHGSTQPLKGMDMNVKTDSTAAAGAARTDASIDLECAIYDLHNMADIADTLVHDALSECPKRITGNPDLYYLSSREHDRILYAVLQTRLMARDLVKSFEDGRVSA